MMVFEKTGNIPTHILSSLQMFLEVRNKIVHGHQSSFEQTVRAIDIGLSILATLNAIPHETNVVYHPGTEVFSDSEGKEPIPDTRALILKIHSASKTIETLRVFPTTKTDYKKGQHLSWEWNDRRIYGRLWYKDPDTNELKSGPTSSMEFIGSDLSKL